MELLHFIQYLTAEKRYSPHTVKAYKNDLEDFFVFIESMYGISEIVPITHVMIRSWVVSLMDQGISTRSINRKISTLKRFFLEQLKNKVIDQNPMQKILSPKISKRLPEFITEKDMDQLTSNNINDHDFDILSSDLIVSILYSTGIRLAELIELENNNVEITGLTIKVTGKRNKERLIPITKQLAKDIENYRNLCLNHKPDYLSQPFLLITKSGKKLYPKYVYRIVNRVLSGLPSISKKSPHILRHTFATHLLNHGAELNAIKELLGHTSLAATQVYTHNSIEKLKKIYQQAHPRA